MCSELIAVGNRAFGLLNPGKNTCATARGVFSERQLETPLSSEQRHRAHAKVVIVS